MDKKVKTRDLDRGVTYWRCKADENRGLHLFVYKKRKERREKKKQLQKCKRCLLYSIKMGIVSQSAFGLR